MPSPFPGMDPFIEGQCWRDFHASVIGQIRSALQPKLRPHYVAFIEEDVYIAKEEGTPLRIVVPDLAVARVKDWSDTRDEGAAVATEPRIVTLPMTVPIEVPYLVIRRRDSDQTVTVIEVLSPTNKSAKDGRGEYLLKRNLLLRSHAHVVELDLLRAGDRLPTIEPHPSGDFFAFVSRVERRPKAEVYAWSLKQPMPCIPIPLAEGDPDVPLDLQNVFTCTYDDAGYDYALKYDREIEPALNKNGIAWVRKVLGQG